jgi:predicted nucleic-acid-binding protein
MSAFVDTNIIVRRLIGEPPDIASRATAYLAAEPQLFLADLVVAKAIYVLKSFYKAPSSQIATAMRSLVALRSVVTVDPVVRALEVYEFDRIDFVVAYLVACAESSGVNRVASFDRSIDRVGTIERVEPRPT